MKNRASWERKPAKKQHRTNVLIDNDNAPFDDWSFIQETKLKPTSLLREKIQEMKQHYEINGRVEMDSYKKKMTFFKEKLEKFLSIASKVMTKEQYQKFLESA